MFKRILFLILITGVLMGNSGLSRMGLYPQELRIRVTQIMLNMVFNPVLYMDEPGSAYMGNILKSCNLLLDELNKQHQNEFLINSMVFQLEEKIRKLNSLKYDILISKKERVNNTRVNYFSVSFP